MDDNRNSRTHDGSPNDPQVWRALFDAAPEAIARGSPDGGFVDVNLAAVQMLGYTREELLAMKVWDVDVRLAADTFAGQIDMIRREGRFSFESQYRKKGGGTVPVEVLVTVIESTNEIISYARDITSRKVHVRQINALKAQFEMFFERSPVAHIIQSSDWVALHVNAAACDLLGYSRDELVGRDPRDLALFASEPSAARERIAANPDCDHSAKISYRRRDGNIVDCEINTRVFLESDGKPNYLSVLQDRSAQMEAERSLKRSLDVQRAILSTSAAGVIHFREGEILMASGTLEQMLGYGAGELVGLHASAIYPEADVHAVVKEATQATRAGSRWQRELQLVRKDRALVWCAIDGAAIDPNDATAGGVYTITDISRYRAQQAHLQRVVREQERMFDNGVVGIAFVKDDVILRCNRYLGRLLAVDPATLVGRTSIDFYVDTAQHALWRGEGRDVMLAGGAYTLDVLIRRGDGSEGYLRLQGAYIDPSAPEEGLIVASYDVDQERRALAALAESESRFQAFGRAVDQGIYISNLTDKRLEYMNGAAPDLWGVTAETLDQGDAKLLELVHEEDIEVFQSHAKRVAQHESSRAEFRIRHSAKGVRWLSNRVFPATSVTGKRLVFGVTEDVTDFKETESALRRAVAAQRAVADAIGAGIVFMRDRVVQDCNLYYAKLAGVPREELIGRHVRAVYTNEAEYDFAENHFQSTQRDPVREYERPFTRRDGSTIQVHVIDRLLTPEAPAQGRVVVVLDVTKQHQQAEALEQALAQQQLVFESLSVGVAILRDRRVAQCNVQYAELLGYEPAEIIGLETQRFYSDEASYEGYSKRLQSGLATGEIVSAEGWAKRKDGALRRVLVSGRALDPTRPMDGILSVIVDITSRHESDLALVQARLEIDAAYEGTAIGLAFSKGGVLVRCNRRFEETLGYDEGELTGMVGSRAFFTSDAQFESITSDVKAALAETGYYEAEQEVQRKDGSRSWAFITVRLFDKTNPDLGRVLSLNDISRSRAQRDQLAQALSQLQLVFEGLAVGVARTRDRRFVETNAAFDKLFGYGRNELVGQLGSVLAATDAEYQAMVARAEEAYAEGKLVSGVRRYQKKDGSLVWCLVAAKPFDTNRPEEGLVSVFYDVTELQLQQQQLQTALLEQRAILDSSVTGLAFSRGRVLERVNRRLAEIAGVPEASLMGRATRFLYTCDAEYDAAYADMVSAAARGEAFVMEKPFTRPDGRVIWVHISSVFTDPAKPERGVVSSILDVTARREQDSALKRALFEQELVLDGLQIGTVMVIDRVIQRCNLQFARLFGRSVDELMGQSSRLLYATDAAFIDAGRAISDALARFGQFDGDIVYQTANGRAITCHDVVKPIDPANLDLGYVSALQDVSEVREQESALTQMRHFLDTVIESMPLSVVVKETQSLRYISANRAATQIFGRSREEFIGHTLPELFDGQLGEKLMELDRQALATGRADRLDFDYYDGRSGTQRHIVSTTVPINDDSGRVLYALTISEDVTEQRVQDVALRESEARFRKFAEVVDEVIFVTNVAGDMVFYLSDRFADVWGGDPSLVRAEPEHFFAMLDSDGRRKLRVALRRARKVLNSDGEVRVQHPSKGARWMRIKTMPTRLETGEIRLFGVVEDITDRKAMAERRLDEQKRHLEVLVREVHHRIKNNLQGVAGLIQQKAIAQPESADFLHEVAGQIQAIAQVHGLQVRSNHALTLRGLVRAIVDNLQRITPASYEVDVGGTDLEGIDLPEGEAVPVALVINELVTNAVKHGAKGRAPVKVKFSRIGDRAMVQVVSQSELPPGFALENVPYGASGLGLVRALIPRRGASLALFQEGPSVVARFELLAPVISFGELPTD